MNLVRGLGGTEETKTALRYFRNKTKEAGFPGLELHLTIRGKGHMEEIIDEAKGTTVLEFINDCGFDGFTHYGFFDFADVKNSYINVLKDVEAEYKKVSEMLNAPYYPNVSMGWDANPRYPQFVDYNVCTDTTPQNIKKGFELAKNVLTTQRD